MTYVRIYFSKKITENIKLTIDADDFHYLKNVMRIKVGKIIKIFNDFDGEFFATIEQINKKNIVLFVNKKLKDSTNEKLDNIHLFVSPIRPHRMSFLIEKCTELGVKEITFVNMKNTSFDIDFEKINMIIKEATEQCERLSFMKVNKTISLDEFLNLKIQFCYLKERDEKSENLYFAKDKKIKNILVGPEGGFDKIELDLLASSNGVSIYLGDLILRSETACLKAISVLSD